MIKYFSPGRVNIIGEHIDYNGGDVLPVCLDIGTYGYVTLRNDNVITLRSKNFEEDGTYEFNGTFSKTNKWFDYVIGCINILEQHGYNNKKYFDLVVEGNIPNGSGLSSSASLEVLMITILNDLNDFKISDENIALYAQQAENEYIGVNCGIMDQFIIANGQENMALKINCSTLQFETIKCNPKTNQFLILNTNSKRGLVDSEYNERRQACELGLKTIQQHFNVENLCELSTEQLDTVELDPTTYRRVKHVISEQKRVEEVVLAMGSDNYIEVGKLLTSSHNSLRDDYEVSCLQLDVFVELALQHGALGARMTGAGFGGCVIALFDHHLSEKDKISLLNDYYDKTNIKGDIYEINIAGKARRIN